MKACQLVDTRESRGSCATQLWACDMLSAQQQSSCLGALNFLAGRICAWRPVQHVSTNGPSNSDPVSAHRAAAFHSAQEEHKSRVLPITKGRCVTTMTTKNCTGLAHLKSACDRWRACHELST